MPNERGFSKIPYINAVQNFTVSLAFLEPTFSPESTAVNR